MDPLKKVKGKKVDEDGIRKKERGASKLQTKKDKPNNVQGDTTIVISDGGNKSVGVKGNHNETSKADHDNQGMSEKERRKLEWESKLAEQKIKNNKENLNKAELRIKRREQQESQRLAKVSTRSEPKSENDTIKLQKEIKSSTLKSAKKDVKKIHVNRVQLVQHLYTEVKEYKAIVNYKDVHPAFVRLGVQYANKIILGSNARCLALLSALQHLILDLQTPSKQEFCRYLESVLQACVTYLHNCRPLAVSVTNALRYFKLQLTQINTDLSDNEKKEKLREVIDIYIKEEIKKAGDAISMRVNEKINNGDIILIYGCSSLIRKILLDAHKGGKRFQVIIIDGRPLLEGREMLRRLVSAGIKCTYVFINAVSYIMESVTKVLLGAHALLTNGYVMSRIGTAQVALVAQSYNKPVLVCCETYKFSERVQTDSFVYNEIGDPEKLVSMDSPEEISPIRIWKENAKITPLNILYDVTPPDLVTAVVTELAILPCTSVPVVLRINAKDTV